MDTIGSIVVWVTNPATTAWVITLFFVLLALRYGRGVAEAFLMKMYEFFIQRNPIKL